jgi:sigma-B regulation protein RsbU (phosphoserine phosphatase)
LSDQQLNKQFTLIEEQQKEPEQLTILIADDDPIAIKLLTGYLKVADSSYDILSAPNGKITIDIAKVKHPDLIITDWEMPVMSGIDTIQALKMDEATKDIPIIMASGNTSSQSLKIALIAGAVDYIRKPVDQVELLARINSALELSRSYKQIKKQTIAIEEAHKKLEEKTKDITASINYASTIQNAILPKLEQLEKVASEHFILFKPRDIVSGDFYWATYVDDKQIVVVADCTGHGVPGAFMSLIGNTLLDKIVKMENILSPDRILTRLHQEIYKVLNQKDGNNLDGMDVAVCQISRDEENAMVKFCGAKRPIAIYRKGNQEVELVKGTNLSIGGRRKRNREFESQTFNLTKDDCIYLFSDGYTDQNNQNGMKLGSRQFISLLGQCAPLLMKRQKELLEECMREHQGETSQRDDILVFGIKI